MNHRMPRAFARPDAFVFAATVSLALILQVRAAPPAAAGAGAKGPAAALVAGSAVNFEGAATCSNAQCHGAAQAKAAPAQAANEYTLWNGGKDPHRSAYRSLTAASPEGQKIWKAYQAIHPELANAQAQASEACLSCHALSVPQARQGKDFKVTEGVTCDACHGPSAKYVDPHKEPGWLPKKYQEFVAAKGNDPAAGHREFLKEWGVFFNKPVVQRAERCTSCHLEIDADMVAAGHPQPKFEINWYSAAVNYPARHWKDDQGYFLAKLWAGGQAVALREAMKQLGDRAKNPATKDNELAAAYNQATAHWSAVYPVVSSGAVGGDAKNMGLWAANLKASFDKKDRAAVAKAAESLRAYAIPLVSAVDKWQPDKASTVKVVAAIGATPPDATPGGYMARDQQRLALFALLNALATGPDKPAEAIEARKVLGAKLFPKEGTSFTPAEKIPADQFAAGLKEVVTKLPK